MQKAYDKVWWTFLDKVLEKFEFSETWQKWIQICISSASFVLVNGELTDFFEASRGLR